MVSPLCCFIKYCCNTESVPGPVYIRNFSASYEDIPEYVKDGRTPDYDEITDEIKTSKEVDNLIPATAPIDSNYYCRTPQPPDSEYQLPVVRSYYLYARFHSFHA